MNLRPAYIAPAFSLARPTDGGEAPQLLSVHQTALRQAAGAAIEVAHHTDGDMAEW